MVFFHSYVSLPEGIIVSECIKPLMNHQLNGILMTFNGILMGSLWDYVGLLVGGLERGFYFSIDWECQHPN